MELELPLSDMDLDQIDVESLDTDNRFASISEMDTVDAADGAGCSPSWGLHFPNSPVFPEVQPVEMVPDEHISSSQMAPDEPLSSTQMVADEDLSSSQIAQKAAEMGHVERVSTSHTTKQLHKSSHSESSNVKHKTKHTIEGKKCPNLDGVVMSLKEVHVGGYKGKPKALDMSNVGEALLALPVFKTESFEQGLVELLAEGRKLLGEGASGEDLHSSPPITPPALTCTQEPPTYTQLGEPEAVGEGATIGDVAATAWAQSRFQYILGAATSPATKVNEETLTYLNQGQSYEVKLKQLGDTSDLKGKFVRSVVRVIFHERRLQYMEKEQLESWKATRPGERILDLDIPLSYGILDVKADPYRTNSVEFLWDPTKNAGLSVKVNCISTEFTAKKHGGEKGVPFRIQVESYLADTPNSYRLYHCASCQVKVFKPKGADRKHKTDREKLEKRQASEREIYQPSYECTVLTEIPVDQVENYLIQLGKHQAEETQKRAAAASTVTIATVASPKPAAIATKKPDIPSPPPTPLIDNIGDLKLSSSSSSLSPQKSKQAKIHRTPSSPDDIRNFGKIQRTPSSPDDIRNFGCLSDNSQSNDSQVHKAMGSSTPIKSPPATKIKIIKAIHKSKPPSTPQLPTPEKTIEPLVQEATAQEVTQWLHHNRFSHYVKVFQNFAGADLLRLSRDDLIQICGLADGIRLNNALQAKTVRPKLTIYLCQNKTRSSHRDSVTSPSTSPSCTIQLGRDHSPSHPLISPAHFIPPQGCEIIHASHHVAPSSTDCTPKVYIQHSSKRQYRESHDQDDEEEVFTKKQRTRHLDLTKKGVYHAIYLEHLTHNDLCDKIAALLSVQPDQLKETYVQGPSGIQVMVTDDVVQNFANESRYLIEAFQDEESVHTEYIVHLTSADGK